MEDFFRANFAKLKGSEAKVLFTLLELGVTQAPSAELMRITGLVDRKTFYDAVRGLGEKGWLDWLRTRLEKPTESWEIQPLELGNQTVVVGKPYRPQLEKPTTSRETLPEQLGNPTGLLHFPTAEESVDFATALGRADEMPSDGDDRNSQSNFQLRRKQQLTLLLEAWADLFGEQLPPLTAKELLIAAHSQALDVYHAMQQANDRQVQYPKAYVRKVLSELAKKRPPEDGGGLQPVTPEMREGWSKNEALLRANGWAWALE